MAKKKTLKLDKEKLTVIVVATLLVGWVFGYLVGAVTADDDNDASSSSSEKLSDHKHGLFEVSAEEAPSVEVLAEADKLGGWNVTLVTENFEFAPADVNEADEIGTGHAHIWVDGEKMGRVYSNYYHLGSLGEGEHEITVTLNTNMHKDYAVDGEVVSSTVEVVEEADMGDGHSHGDSHSDDDGHSHSDDKKHMGDDTHMHMDGEEHSHSN